VNDGQAVVTPSGGTSPYFYNWSAGSSDSIQTNLPAGLHSVTVTDANNCDTVLSVKITEPSPLQVNTSVSQYAGSANISCHGASDGSIDITVNGGSSPYNYNWSNGDNTQDLSSIGAGTYTLTVSDANYCDTVVSVTLDEPPVLTVDTNAVTDAGNGNNGSIDLTVSGGTSSYNYNWSNNATSQDISGLSAGNYTVTVTDANLCADTLTVTAEQGVGIAQNPSLKATRLSPNPNSGRFQLRLSSKSAGEITLSIYDIAGKVVRQEKGHLNKSHNTIDMSEQPEGVYLLRLKTERSAVVKKLLVR
jgi:hypothetical protein